MKETGKCIENSIDKNSEHRRQADVPRWWVACWPDVSLVNKQRVWPSSVHVYARLSKMGRNYL